MSTGGSLDAYADLRLLSGEASSHAARINQIGTFSRFGLRLANFVQAHDPIMTGAQPDELIAHALSWFHSSVLPVQLTDSFLDDGNAGLLRELSDRARYASDATRKAVVRARITSIVRSQDKVRAVLNGAPAADAYSHGQRLAARLAPGLDCGELSTWIELNKQLVGVPVPHNAACLDDTIADMLTFCDDRSRRISSTAIGGSAAGAPSSGTGARSFSAASELSELLASDLVIGPTGLVQKIKDVVDQTDSVEILRIALDAKLVPVFQHVWIKDSTDSHELFALLASHTSSRDDFAAYYMSVDDDGSVVGPYSPLMFKRLTDEQRTHIATKAKNWKIGEVDSAGKRDATFIDNLRKGKWSTLLLDMFSLFLRWRAHFGLALVPGASTLGDVLTSSVFMEFCAFAARAFGSLGFPRAPTDAARPGISEVLQTAKAHLGTSATANSMLPHCVVFLQSMMTDAQTDYLKYISPSTSPSTGFPGLFKSTYGAFGVIEEHANSTITLSRMMAASPLFSAFMAQPQIVPAPHKPPPSIITIDGGAANKRENPSSGGAGPTPKKGKKKKGKADESGGSFAPAADADVHDDDSV